MWDHPKITLKTSFSRIECRKENGHIKTGFFEKNFPTCREIPEMWGKLQ